MTESAHRTNPGRRDWRKPALIGGVLVMAVIVGLLFALFAGRDPGIGTGGDSSPSVSPTPSEPASPSANPSPSEEPEPSESPEPTPVAAPEEWTLVHQFGDGSARWAGGEIAHGGAGFLAIGRRYEGGEGGPRIAEYAMWLSADGREWTEVAYPSPGDGGRYDPAALSGAADGSFVLHALRFSPDVVGTALVSLRSTDGTTWEPIETGLRADMFVQSVEEGPAGYLLVGAQGHEVNPTLWLSSDALTWELVHEFSQDERFVQLYGADGGAEGYVVVGRRIEQDSSSYERFAFASADGREWVERVAPFGPDDQAFVWDVAVTSHGGDWLATMGDRNDTITLWSSANGLDWSELTTLQGPANRQLATTGLFEEVGDELILSPVATVSEFGTTGTWSSTDGTTWSPVDLGADAFLGQLAIGDGVVAVTGTIPASGESAASTAGIWIRAVD